MTETETKSSSKGLIALIVAAVLVLGCVPGIGILAAIAIPAFIGYTKRAKITEARSNVRLLAASAQRRCAMERIDPTGGPTQNGLPGPAGPIPATVPAGTAVVATQELTANPVFSELGFAPAEPLRYSYEIASEGTAIIIRARGDLDGDGTFSTFETRCTSSSDGCRCDDGIVVENEAE